MEDYNMINQMMNWIELITFINTHYYAVGNKSTYTPY